MGVTFVLLAASFAVPAYAQVLVLPASTQDDAAAIERVRASAAQIADELTARGERALRPADAVQRFERTHSSSSAPLEPGELEALQTCANDALYQVASGRYGASQRTVQRCLEIGNRALSTLNRETRAARQLFDACLYMVRARLGQRDTEGARAEAARCRMLVPDLAPDERQHPPEVVSLVAQVDQELSAGAGSTLHVRAAGDDRCRAFVNGRRLGETPLDLTNLPPGDYRVQLECAGGATRVHRAVLGSEARTLEIDPVLDSVVRTGDTLALVYASAAMHERRVLADARTIAEHVRPTDMWVVSSESAERLRIDRVDVPARRVIASAWLARSAETGAIADATSIGPAIEALGAERSLDLTGLLPEAREPWAPPGERDGAGVAATSRRAQGASAGAIDDEPPPRGSESASSGWLGWTAAGIGVVGLGFTVGLYVHRADARDWAGAAHPEDPDYEARWQRYEDTKPWHVVSAIASVPFTVAAALLLAPADDGVPWWAWGAGVAGVALAAFGIYDLVRDGACVQRLSGECVGFAINDDRAFVWLAFAVPSLSLPITYLVRGASGSDAEARVVASADSVGLTIGGTIR